MKLTIYADRSVLETDGTTSEFVEGVQTNRAKNRASKIQTAFSDGYLEDLISTLSDNPASDLSLSDNAKRCLDELVDSVTSEVGRALVGLSVLQAAIKAIEPEQSIRLHKGGRSSAAFSWTEGLSMRVLDKNYITPTLRRHKLLSLNADGFMMTRSLAENYPYSKLYKAQLRGARAAWLDLVEGLEDGSIDGLEGLTYLLSRLINKSSDLEELAEKAIAKAENLSRTLTADEIYALVQRYVYRDSYSARLFEVMLHAAFQVLDEKGQLDGSLKPLSQMRSANKKHKNVGDVEVETRPGSRLILESWDAKFGKSHLREEVEELYEKLADQPECFTAGFVTNGAPVIDEEIRVRIAELEDTHGTDLKIPIFDFDMFLEKAIYTRVSKTEFAPQWLVFFVSSLAQKRRHIAPIDEPCEAWLRRFLAL
ncbi:hypothetical protein EI983_18710 [Roseovarius faecimaris]|uniref:DNA methyltransferase n=1 Tax=Roseovarius faecimaris TaxID=2494550 RepID=A0A6I6IW75_9RHOB|nr:hypothetical protein [Roseovarius faecimaris]QGY00184.1 hypothetical protein EI983_18710 [Roseovarius faecimaris]